MDRKLYRSASFLQLPDTILISIITILCFNGEDEPDFDDSRFSLQFISKKFYTLFNCEALWQNKPIISPTGKFNEGAFKLIKRKTQGTEGYCYHAYCRPHRKEYAVKRVNRISSDNDGVPYYMLRILSALRNLRHPGINELLYVSLAGPKLYTIYPYVELTLQDVLVPAQQLADIRGSSVTSPLKHNVAIDWMSQLMSAISYLHDRGILHRNLKPKHILIILAPTASSDGSRVNGAVLKITDFSLARTTFHPPRNLTAEVITLWYRPPEILLGDERYTAAVDVWSAGCIFAEMLEGRPLFVGLSQIDQLFQIFSKLGSPSEGSSCRTLPFYQDEVFPNWPQNLLRNSMRSLCRARVDDGHSVEDNRLLDDMCIDLLNRFLTFESSSRITAKEALSQLDILKDFELPIPVLTESKGAGPDCCDALHLTCQAKDVPYSIEVQRNFLESLENSRNTECSSHAGPSSLPSHESKNDGVWEEMGHGDTFSVIDWMIKISDQFSEFTCTRTVFLAAALMGRYKMKHKKSVAATSVSEATSHTPHNGSDNGLASGASSSSESEAGTGSRLLGATCLHVASKLEDVSFLGVRDLLALMAESDSQWPYTVADMLQMEEALLTESGFELYVPTVIDFLHIYFDSIPCLRGEETVHCMSRYLGEVTLLFPSQFGERHASSHIATAIVSYSMTYFKIEWEIGLLMHLSECSSSSVSCCVRSVAEAHKAMDARHIESSTFRRYDVPKFFNISQLPCMASQDLQILQKKLCSDAVYRGVQFR